MNALTALGLIYLLIVASLILRRAGYSAGWSLLLLVPLVNMVAVLVFALSTWPVEHKLALARVEAGRADNDDYWLALEAARKAERAGDCDRAIALYKRIIETGGEHPAVMEAEQRLADAADALPADRSHA